MKRLDAKKDVVCMSCSGCEVACSQAFYKSLDPSLSCVQIVRKKDGTVRPVFCVQCGKCARVCPEEAITQNAKGVYMINKKKCKGCGICVTECPFGVVIKTEGNPAAKCIVCGICVKVCPMELLYIKEG
ncbi:MAG: 4Fe-4S binding protein [Oscillospiraceae bacterium]|jgi:Fe-S-cluster-containing hydrogenase component 2|nr:4Fe-4S binding protein [Oscillospiraceae bacterium]